ncbi:MAG: aspartate/glutamate racemase family protein [Bacteroidota bacterium]
MKKIGLIGGMSWESSQIYYQLVNQKVKEALGGFHSARCVMDSVDFAEIERLQMVDDWEAMSTLMAASAQNLEKAGADIVVLCTNTMHLCSDAIKASINIPFLHIAEATARRIKAQGLKKVLLLGTRFTMEKAFFKDILSKDFGIEVIIPNKADRSLVHDVIYEELVLGKISDTSRKVYQEIIAAGAEAGAEGAILGCTEIPLLIQQEHVQIPVFETTRIHAEAAVGFALA